MSNRDRLAVALSLAASVLAGVAQAGETELPAAKFFPYLREYLALGVTARDRFAPIYVLHAKHGGVAGTQAWLVLDGKKTPLAIGPDGQVAAPANAADVSRGKVAITTPPGSGMGVRMEVASLVPARPEIPTRLLEASLEQANHALHTGVPFVSPPPFRRVMFEGADGGEIASPDGQRSPLPLREGVAYYEPSGAAHPAAVRFRRPPSRMVLNSDR